MIFKENMIFELKNERYRIVGNNNEDIFVLDITNNREKWNQVISLVQLEKMLKNKEISIEDGKENINIKNIEINEKMTRKREFYYEIVCFLLKNSYNKEIFYKNTRKEIIDEAKKKYKISETTIKRILYKYLKSGKIVDSLIPDYSNCGGRGKIRINRKGKTAITEDIIKLFKAGINKYYNTPKKNSIRICYELIIRDYLKINNNTEEFPTLKQFYYWFEKLTENNRKNEISKRYGDRIYQQKSRAIIGNSLQDAIAPANLYQIDSTILDVYIVSRLNRNLIIGRPVLYFVIDTYSRMIVGINVTIEPFNSYAGVKGALINAMTDKVSYCKAFEIDIKKEEWDVSCIPSRLLADRGELLSADIENAISNLGIMVQNTPPYRGDMKGIVEKSFERIHSYIKPFCDGVVENKFNKVERGAEDYRLKANLTLYEITKIIIKYVLFHNNYHVLEYYESDGLTIESDIPKIPCKIWFDGVKKKSGLLRELSEEIIKINLLSNKEATVTAKGVRFNKLFYVSKYTLEEGWYQKSRIEGSFKIRISYNPDNVGEIYYIKNNGLSYDTLTLVTYMEQYRDLSEEELIKVLEYQQKMNKDASKKEIKEKVELFDEIEKITNKAKEEQERSKDKTISKAKRLRNIRENLKEERKYIKKEEKFKEELVEDDDELDIFENNALEGWNDDYE